MSSSRAYYRGNCRPTVRRCTTTPAAIATNTFESVTAVTAIVQADDSGVLHGNISSPMEHNERCAVLRNRTPTGVRGSRAWQIVAAARSAVYDPQQQQQQLQQQLQQQMHQQQPDQQKKTCTGQQYAQEQNSHQQYRHHEDTHQKYTQQQQSHQQLSMFQQLEATHQQQHIPLQHAHQQEEQQQQDQLLEEQQQQQILDGQKQLFGKQNQQLEEFIHNDYMDALHLQDPEHQQLLLQHHQHLRHHQQDQVLLDQQQTEQQQEHQQHKRRKKAQVQRRWQQLEHAHSKHLLMEQKEEQVKVHQEQGQPCQDEQDNQGERGQDHQRHQKQEQHQEHKEEQDESSTTSDGCEGGSGGGNGCRSWGRGMGGDRGSAGKFSRQLQRVPGEGVKDQQWRDITKAPVSMQVEEILGARFQNSISSGYSTDNFREQVLSYGQLESHCLSSTLPSSASSSVHSLAMDTDTDHTNDELDDAVNITVDMKAVTILDEAMDGKSLQTSTCATQETSLAIAKDFEVDETIVNNQTIENGEVPSNNCSLVKNNQGTGLDNEDMTPRTSINKIKMLLKKVNLATGTGERCDESIKANNTLVNNNNSMDENSNIKDVVHKRRVRPGFRLCSVSELPAFAKLLPDVNSTQHFPYLRVVRSD